MSDLWQGFLDLITAERVVQISSALLVLAVGIFFAHALRRFVRRLAAERFDAQSAMIAARVVYYLSLGLVVAVALHQAGFEIGIVLGAAGVLTVALGFAAQTSMSNLISGIFLMMEGPFRVGDNIRIGGTTGEVKSVDLLSVKLRTFDNLFVRIPNETLLKSEITNLSRYPIRRVDVPIGVAYREDISRVEALLVEVADRHHLSLDEPRPLFQVLGYGDSAVNLQFSVWCVRQNYIEVSKRLRHEIKEAFAEAGIEIPFPHRTLTAGEPLPVRFSGEEEDTAPKVPS